MSEGESLEVARVGAKDRAKEEGDGKRVRPLRPSQCRSHMRKTLAREFNAIVDGFVKAAKKGSCPHVKLVTELLEEPPRSSTRKKGSVAQLLKKLDSEQANKERLNREQSGQK